MIKTAFVTKDNYICQIKFKSYIKLFNIKYTITIKGKASTYPGFNIYRL